MGGKPSKSKRHLHSSPSIADNYYKLEQVTEALKRANLESSNLIIGIDFSKSNERTGAGSFNNRSMHHLGDTPNPYEQALSIIDRNLSKYDEDGDIPCFGFGDERTQDHDVFSFNPDDNPCNGFKEVQARYKELVPQLQSDEPTSFAPIIEMAIDVVEKSDGQYHVLLIITDGQVTRSGNTKDGQFSPQEQDTIDAIVKASKYPLSIVVVGVGNGPWDMMWQFDDNIPSRAYDNFQFVNFTELMSRDIPDAQKDEEFALAALMEIPSQFKATIDLRLLSCQGGTIGRIPLPPPDKNTTSENSAGYRHSASAPQSEYPPNDDEVCILGKKGFIHGLFLFLLLICMTWRSQTIHLIGVVGVASFMSSFLPRILHFPLHNCH